MIACSLHVAFHTTTVRWSIHPSIEMGHYGVHYNTMII